MRQFLRCPACNEVIPVGESTCKYCSAEIADETARQAAEQFAKISEACTLANNLNTLTPVAPLVLAVYGFITLMDWANLLQRPIVYAFPLVPLFTVLYWHLTYGKLRTKDPDFQQAQRDVKKSLLVWIPTSLVLLIFLALWHRR